MIVNEALNKHSNYVAMPRALYHLGLSAGAIAAHGFLASLINRNPEDKDRYTCYALGKLLESEERKTEAAKWHKRAATQGNKYAQYRLAKLCLTGNGVPKDVGRAVELLEASAKRGNQYAQYTLGKIYLQGYEVGQNMKLAEYWLYKAAEQGHAYAQFFLDHMNEPRKPTLMLAVTRLLHCLGGIFESSRPLDATSRPIEIDRKRFAELQEKRVAMGHKPDDHEDQPYNGMSMATPW